MALLSKGRLSILLLGAASAATHLYTDDIARLLAGNHDPVKIIDPRYQSVTAPVQIGPAQLKNAFAFIRPEVGAEETYSPAPSKIPPASEKGPTIEYREDIRKALFFYDKFNGPETSHVKKFDNLLWAYQSIGEKIENAGDLGLKPHELARLMREHGARSIQESLQKIAEGQGSALEQILHVNNLRVALDYAGIMDDGTNNRAYAEQIAGVEYETLRERILTLSPQAARLAIDDLRQIPADYKNLSDNAMQQTFTKFELVNYAFNKSELSAVLGKRPAQRHAALGLSPEEWSGLNEKWTEMEDHWKEKLASYVPQNANPHLETPTQRTEKTSPPLSSWGNTPSPFHSPTRP